MHEGIINPMTRTLYLLLFSGLIACSATAATQSTVKLAVNPWTASAVNAQVAKILLEEKLGYRVDLVAIDENTQFAALGRNDLDASLEIWPSGHVDHYRTYVQEQKTVEDLGPLGVQGKIGGT